MSLVIKKIPVTDWEQNCRLVIDSETSEVVVVDPGGDAKKIAKYIQEQELKIIAIWLTHSHLDHCGGVAELKELYNVPLYGHRIESEFRSHVEDLLKMYGVSSNTMQNCPEPEFYIEEGQTVSCGAYDFTVLFVPGHSPGHVVFYNAANSELLAGDTVFKGSIGRTDLPGGNHKLLIEGIRSKILSLPANTKILPGHGDDTTVGAESKSNPFLV